MADTESPTSTATLLRALIIHADDNVANLIGSGVRGLPVACTVEGHPEAESIELVTDVPQNHKFARCDIVAGAPILKYGLSIGKATKPIRRGEHVHTQNVESNRGRGDLQNS
ncbi:MAG: UxaA family hydrolase [Gemmatimonadaceae bacterium]